MKLKEVLSIMLISFVGISLQTDCLSWGVTKRADYLEILPLLMYYPRINWININPSSSCTVLASTNTLVKADNQYIQFT